MSLPYLLYPYLTVIALYESFPLSLLPSPPPSLTWLIWKDFKWFDERCGEIKTKVDVASYKQRRYHYCADAKSSSALDFIDCKYPFSGAGARAISSLPIASGSLALDQLLSSLFSSASAQSKVEVAAMNEARQSKAKWFRMMGASYSRVLVSEIARRSASRSASCSVSPADTLASHVRDFKGIHPPCTSRSPMALRARSKRLRAARGRFWDINFFPSPIWALWSSG